MKTIKLANIVAKHIYKSSDGVGFTGYDTAAVELMETFQHELRKLQELFAEELLSRVYENSRLNLGDQLTDTGYDSIDDFGNHIEITVDRKSIVTTDYSDLLYPLKNREEILTDLVNDRLSRK